MILLLVFHWSCASNTTENYSSSVRSLRAVCYIYCSESLELSSSDSSKLCIDQCKLQLSRHEKLEWQNWMPVSSYANDIEKEFQARGGFASSHCGLLSIFFDKQTGIFTIHQLLNVSTSQGPLCSSATLGNVTRQSSVCHKLSKIIDACYSFLFVFFPSFFPWAVTSLKASLLIIQHGWAEGGCLPLSLILANQMEKGWEGGMILNISARADFDLSFWMP